MPCMTAWLTQYDVQKEQGFSFILPSEVRSDSTFTVDVGAVLPAEILAWDPFQIRVLRDSLISAFHQDRKLKVLHYLVRWKDRKLQTILEANDSDLG